MVGIFRTAALTLTVLLALPVAADEPGREFTAEAVVKSREGRRRMLLTLVAHRFTPVEELRDLASKLK